MSDFEDAMLDDPDADSDDDEKKTTEQPATAKEPPILSDAELIADDNVRAFLAAIRGMSADEMKYFMHECVQKRVKKAQERRLRDAAEHENALKFGDDEENEHLGPIATKEKTYQDVSTQKSTKFLGLTVKTPQIEIIDFFKANYDANNQVVDKTKPKSKTEQEFQKFVLVDDACSAEGEQIIPNCQKIKRINFWLSVLDQLIKVMSYEKSIDYFTTLLTKFSAIYTLTLLTDDFHHLQSVHCSESQKLRFKLCEHHVDECPFIQDRQGFKNIINQMHVSLFHENKPVFRAMKDKQLNNGQVFNRFVVDGSTAQTASKENSGGGGGGTGNTSAKNKLKRVQTKVRNLMQSTTKSKAGILDVSASIDETAEDDDDDAVEENGNGNERNPNKKSRKAGHSGPAWRQKGGGGGATDDGDPNDRSNKGMMYDSDRESVELSDSEEEEDDDDRAAAKFGVLDFGESFEAWNITQPVFGSIEEEVTKNQYASISQEELDLIIIESKKLAHTYLAKKYGLSTRDIMVLKLYTDQSKLCANFRKCYRKTLRAADQLVRRREFFHWARYLRFLFKFKSVPTNRVLHHGLSVILTIDSLIPQYFGPVSLSKERSVAISFAGNNGMLLEVQSGLIGATFYSIRGFDVSWISCYGNEAEFLVYDCTLPIKQNQIVDYQDMEKQTSYLNNLMNVLAGNNDHAAMKKMIKHWLPVIVNNKRLFEGREMFGGISLFHLLYYHRRLYHIIMKPVLKSREEDIILKHGSIFQFLCGDMAFMVKDSSTFYLHLSEYAQALFCKPDSDKNWPMSVTLLTSVSEAGKYYESEPNAFNDSHMAAAHGSHTGGGAASGSLSSDFVLENDTLMNWNSLLNHTKVNEIEMDDKITIYYKLRILFEDKKIGTRFPVMSDVKEFELTCQELLSHPCYTDLKTTMDDYKGDERDLKHHLVTEKFDTISCALYCNEMHKKVMPIQLLQTPAQKAAAQKPKTKKESYLTYLFCKLGLVHIIKHPKMSQLWMHNLFSMHIQVVNQTLYALVDYKPKFLAYPPPIPKKWILYVHISGPLKKSTKELKKFQWREFVLETGKNLNKGSKYATKSCASLVYDNIGLNNVDAPDLIDWQTIALYRLLYKNNKNMRAKPELFLYYKMKVVYETDYDLSQYSSNETKKKVEYEMCTSPTWINIGTEINLVIPENQTMTVRREGYMVYDNMTLGKNAKIALHKPQEEQLSNIHSVNIHCWNNITMKHNAVIDANYAGYTMAEYMLGLKNYNSCNAGGLGFIIGEDKKEQSVPEADDEDESEGETADGGGAVTAEGPAADDDEEWESENEDIDSSGDEDEEEIGPSPTSQVFHGTVIGNSGGSLCEYTPDILVQKNISKFVKLNDTVIVADYIKYSPQNMNAETQKNAAIEREQLWRYKEKFAITYEEQLMVTSFTICAEQCYQISVIIDPMTTLELSAIDAQQKVSLFKFEIPASKQKYGKLFELQNVNWSTDDIRLKWIKIEAIRIKSSSALGAPAADENGAAAAEAGAGGLASSARAQQRLQPLYTYGNGGGCIKLKAHQITINNDCRLMASGSNAKMGGAGGGAGGSIVIDCHKLRFRLHQNYEKHHQPVFECLGGQGKFKNPLTKYGKGHHGADGKILICSESTNSYAGQKMASISTPIPYIL